MDRVLENWRQMMPMILTMMAEMTVMVVAVIIQDLAYGDLDDYVILVL
jgi:hypothetical protein